MDNQNQFDNQNTFNPTPDFNQNQGQKPVQPVDYTNQSPVAPTYIQKPAQPQMPTQPTQTAMPTYKPQAQPVMPNYPKPGQPITPAQPVNPVQPQYPQYNQPQAPSYQPMPQYPHFGEPMPSAEPSYNDYSPSYVQPHGYVSQNSGNKNLIMGILSMVFTSLSSMIISGMLRGFSEASQSYSASEGSLVIVSLLSIIFILPGFILAIINKSSVKKELRATGKINGKMKAGKILSTVAFVLSLILLIVLGLLFVVSVLGVAGSSGYIA
jgi:hypothetical protein